MNKNEIIDKTSFCSLIFALTKASFLGSGFIYILNEIKKTSVFSILIGLILGIGLSLIFYQVFKTDEKETIVGKFKKTFPSPIFYTLIILILIALFLIGGFLFFRLVSFLSSHYLTKTPTIIIGFLLISGVCYLGTKNIEVLTRFSTISFVFCLMILLSNFLSILPSIDISNLKPILITDIPITIKSIIVTALLFSGPTFLLTSIKKSNVINNIKLKKNFIIFLILSSIALFLIFFCIITSLGTELVQLFTYPEYIVLKKINFFNFISSIENISILLWFFYIVITSSFCLIFTKNTICETFKVNKKKYGKIIVFIVTILALVTQYILFYNDYSLDNPKLVFFSASIFLFFLIICIIYLIVYKLKNKSRT